MWVGDPLPSGGNVWTDWVPNTYPQFPVHTPEYHYHYTYPYFQYPNEDIYEKARKYDAIMKKHPKLKLEEKKAEIKALAKGLGVKIKFA